jgi:hypothetical protein
MARSHVWWNSTDLIVQIFGKIGMLISRLFRRKSRLCSLGIIRNTVLFIFPIEMFSFSSISRDYMPLQVPCHMVVDWSAWFESSIPRSLESDVQIHFIYLMCHAALMLLIFLSFCVLDSIVSYNQFKHVIKVGAFDRRWAFCGRPKFSFNCDRRSTSCFKNFPPSQKVNSFPRAIHFRKNDRSSQSFLIKSMNVWSWTRFQLSCYTPVELTQY